MDLKDTISRMSSDDFKERFVAEYHQTKIRYEKLHKMLIKYEAKNYIGIIIYCIGNTVMMSDF